MVEFLDYKKPIILPYLEHPGGLLFQCNLTAVQQIYEPTSILLKKSWWMYFNSSWKIASGWTF